VRALNGDVNVLFNDVFGCTFPGDPLVQFDDGSFAYVLYYDVLCTTAANPDTATPDGQGLSRIDRRAG
jgi:hypothetical protein